MYILHKENNLHENAVIPFSDSRLAYRRDKTSQLSFRVRIADRGNLVVREIICIKDSADTWGALKDNEDMQVIPCGWEI